jgi:TonB family protein
MSSKNVIFSTGMRMKEQKQKQASSFLIALLISLLLHQLFLAVFGEFWPEEKQEVEESRQRIMLVDAPKPPAQGEPIPAPQAPSEVVKALKPPAPKSGRVHEPEKPAPEAVSSNLPVIEPWPEQALPQSAEPSASNPGRDVNIKLNWKAFETAFENEARTDREAYEQASLEKRRGFGFYGRFSSKVEKALKSNKGWVAPGNQEPLGNRNEIFHRYIYEIHEKQIHTRFADGFWDSLSSFSPTHPLNDISLNAWAEFEILANGYVNEVRLVKSSGNTVFDAAAVDSIYRSSPFPAPPKEILSWNNRVYLRWGFYRSTRKCGVFNVEPYIIKAPDAEKEDISIKEYIKNQG